MKSKKAKGFGHINEMPDLNNLACQVEAETTKLHEIISNPSGRGEIDAWLGIEPTDDAPAYKAAYDKTQAAKLLASPQDLEILQIIQPVMRDVIKKLSSNPAQFDILETARSLMERPKQS